MFQIIPKYSKLFQNIPIFSKKFQFFPKNSNFFQKIPKYSNFFQSNPKHSKIFQNIPKYSKTFQNNPIFSKFYMQSCPKLNFPIAAKLALQHLFCQFCTGHEFSYSRSARFARSAPEKLKFYKWLTKKKQKKVISKALRELKKPILNPSRFSTET